MLRLSHPGRRGGPGCATRGPAGLDLDTSVNAVSQSSRVRAIVIHYTTEDDARSMQLLSKGKGAHYLLSPRVAPTAWSTKRAPPGTPATACMASRHEQHVHRH